MTDFISDPVHELGVLATEVGPPNPALLTAILAGTSDADLIEVGRTIATERVIVDTARLYRLCWTWWKQAAPEYKKLIRGASEPLMVLAVHQALNLEKTRQQRNGKSSTQSVAQAGLDKATSDAADTALKLRDQAHRAMRDAAGLSDSHRDEADEAVGTAETVDALATGLESLSDLLDKWLNSGDKVLEARLMLASLDADYASELAAAAKHLRTSKAQAGQKQAETKVTQGALDREDGVNVLLLGQIIRAFDAAHDINPIVPRLVPISTRRLFNRSSRKKKSEAPVEKSDPTQA